MLLDRMPSPAIHKQRFTFAGSRTTFALVSTTTATWDQRILGPHQLSCDSTTMIVGRSNNSCSSSENNGIEMAPGQMTLPGNSLGFRTSSTTQLFANSKESLWTHDVQEWPCHKDDSGQHGNHKKISSSRHAPLIERTCSTGKFLQVDWLLRVRSKPTKCKIALFPWLPDR